MSGVVEEGWTARQGGSELAGSPESTLKLRWREFGVEVGPARGL
jgi:hypothetical protein